MHNSINKFINIFILISLIFLVFFSSLNFYNLLELYEEYINKTKYLEFLKLQNKNLNYIIYTFKNYKDITSLKALLLEAQKNEKIIILLQKQTKFKKVLLKNRVKLFIIYISIVFFLLSIAFFDLFKYFSFQTKNQIIQPKFYKQKL